MKSVLGSVWNWVVGAASFASIAGLVVAIVADNNAVIVALVALCMVYKQFQHVVVNPDPGYIYRIIWEK